MIEAIETGLDALGGIAGLGTLAFAMINMLLAQRRPSGQQIGAAQKILRTPYLVIASVIFIGLGYALWKPLPVLLAQPVSLVISVIGAIIFFPSLGLYIWGLSTLGKNFNASSGFGVRLNQSHQLITSGPYAYLRHPMYLAVILSGWGGLLIYRTWTMAGFAVMMLGLLYRGRREEEALAGAFGNEWEAYKQAVPGWLPRFMGTTRKDSQ